MGKTNRILITGTDQYRIDELLRERTCDSNVKSFTADAEVNQILLELNQDNLFSEASSCIIKDLVSKVENKILRQILTHESETLVIFVEAVSPKDQDLKRMFQKYTTIYNFPSLNKYQIKEWLNKKAAEFNLALNGKILDELVARYGVDLYRQTNELMKLQLYYDTSPANPKVINGLREAAGVGDRTDIYQTLDGIGERSFDSVVAKLNDLFRETEEWYVFYSIVRYIRNLISVKNNHTKGINPYLVSKLKRFTSNWQMEELVALLVSLLSLEYWVKQGGAEVRYELLNWVAQQAAPALI